MKILDLGEDFGAHFLVHISLVDRAFVRLS